MKLKDKVCVVTGGAHGIGRALSERFVLEGALAVVVADQDFAAAALVGEAALCDVSREADVQALIEQTLAKYGRIDLFVSNAGIARGGGAEAPDESWEQSWHVNVMAHVWAARHVGYLLATASAAGLLTSIGSAPYAATKHAAVAFAEWLSITHHEQGIRVSCLCPQGVNTELLNQAVREPAGKAVLMAGAVLEPEQVAECTVRALEEERFLILPHPEVTAYVNRKAQEHERWLASMRSLQRKVLA
jgi:NAD(P)-dependent dehydrogenase (short-subunit alcohol dehydrogenase family)